MKEIFYGMEKISLVDFDGYVCCTLFTKGCNFHCKWCHNGPLVDGDNIDVVNFHDILAYLKERKNIIDAVCITGGEPTINKELPFYIEKIKELGLLVKLDTNGTNPEMLEALIDKKLVDYVAMDIKSGLNSYHLVVDKINPSLEKIKKSIDILKKGLVNYEFRTTLISEYHTIDEIMAIGILLDKANTLYLQHFKERDTCITLGFHEVCKKKALEYKSFLEKYVQNVNLRGY